MIKKIRNYIFTGFLITLPLFISLLITLWLFKLVTNGIMDLMPSYIKHDLFWQAAIRLLIPVILVLLLALIGLFTRVLLIKRLFSLGEKILVRIPLFNTIYIAIKQISQALLSEEKTIFNRVVLVEYPRRGIYSLGFVTSKEKFEIHKKAREDLISIFVPTSPNPTSGMLIFVPEAEVIEVQMTIEEGMKLVISGGAVVPHIEGDK